MKIKKIVLAALYSALFAVMPVKAQGDIVFLSDFGLIDDSVSQCKAAAYAVYPEARITDMTHNIPPFNTKVASFLLAEAARIWPPGTIFVAVVDPGVGTSRNPVAILTKSGHYYIGPDNGIFTLPAKNLGIDKIVALDNREFFRKDVSDTFHGRDIFMPVAAELAKKPASFDKLGSKLPNIQIQHWEQAFSSGDGIKASVLYIERPYGNVWTDIPAALIARKGIIKGTNLDVKIGAQKISLPFMSTFGDVPQKQPLAYINSRGLLAFALNMDNFANTYGADSDDDVEITFSTAALTDVKAMTEGKIFFSLKYATPDNFTGKTVYPPTAKCLLRRSAAQAIAKAADYAIQSGFRLCVYDCYRPLSVQKKFWEIMPDPRYVADPAKGSVHNRGLAVDLVPCDANGTPLEMQSSYDEFSEKAHRSYSGASQTAVKNKELLDQAMTSAGFTGLPTEWWHYDFPGQAEVMDIPFPQN